MDDAAYHQGHQSMSSAEILQQYDNLEHVLGQLAFSPIHELRQKWSELFSASAPAAFGPDLLRRSIAQRLQEDAFGKLSRSTQRELDRIIRTMERAPNGHIELPRRIKPGCVLVRDWKGKSHRVSVLDQGFGYDGATYSSLSEIARQITGSRWNGPRFFGLRAASP